VRLLASWGRGFAQKLVVLMLLLLLLLLLLLRLTPPPEWAEHENEAHSRVQWQ
jgi:hypothetical protein